MIPFFLSSIVNNRQSSIIVKGTLSSIVNRQSSTLAKFSIQVARSWWPVVVARWICFDRGGPVAGSR
jgi:hypothetical protein